jgi:hypothetical protein
MNLIFHNFTKILMKIPTRIFRKFYKDLKKVFLKDLNEDFNALVH